MEFPSFSQEQFAKLAEFYSSIDGIINSPGWDDQQQGVHLSGLLGIVVQKLSENNLTSRLSVLSGVLCEVMLSARGRGEQLVFFPTEENLTFLRGLGQLRILGNDSQPQDTLIELEVSLYSVICGYASTHELEALFLEVFELYAQTLLNNYKQGLPEATELPIQKQLFLKNAKQEVLASGTNSERRERLRGAIMTLARPVVLARR